MEGTVADFDEERGLGTVESDGSTYPFHCTSIVGGSRTIEAGAGVRFELRPGGMGRWEAAQIAAT